MPTYTLFHNPMSRGQIARWALHEAGADYAVELVDWTAKPAALLDANPMAKVPTLVHLHEGDHVHVVTEAAAICHYLAEMHPEAGLLPEAHEKADYFRWMFFTAGPAEAAIINHAMGWESDDPQKQGTLGYGSFERVVDALEVMLTGRDYVCGDRFTMADVYVGSQIDWGLQFGTLPMRDVFAAYQSKLRERPAYQAAKAIDMKLIEEAQAAKG